MDLVRKELVGVIFAL